MTFANRPVAGHADEPTTDSAKARGACRSCRPSQSDSLLALIALANADPRPDKIDVGVGVFRDGGGNTPILKVMKEAEQRLLDTQETKSYLGSAGDKRFAELLRPILLGEHADDERIAGLQTPGGCGALRLGFELIATANPERARAGRNADLAQPSADHRRGRARDRRISLLRARAGRDPLRRHAGRAARAASRATSRCSTAAATTRPAPTSTTISGRGRRRRVASAGLIPLVDIAYQGFGRGLDEDAAGLRGMLSTPATR